jgi:predicted metal-dependent hydrolase
MHEPGTIRRLYQGILQVGVGFYHLRNGNYRGTLNLLHSAAGYLRDFAPICLGVDVAALLRDAATVRAAVEAGGPAQIGAFPLATLPQIAVDPAIAARAIATPPPAEIEGEGGPGHW